MKWLFVLFHLLTVSVCADTVEHPSFLKGVSSFTVYSQVSPHELDLALKSTLEKLLAPNGSMIQVKTANDQFYAAMSNTIFLRLSLETQICSTTAGQFQVKVHLVLECIDQSIRQAESTAMSRWICEKEVDFSPEKKVLVSKCQQVVNDLVTQFLDLNRQINPEIKEKPTFFIL